jgi:hypothetical protein
MTRNEWLILGGAGILGFYFYKKSQAIPVAASSIKTALTTPTALNSANIAAIGADAQTIWSAIQGMFSTPATPLTSGGNLINDSWGTVPVNALVTAPVGNPLTTNPFSVNGYPRNVENTLSGWTHGRKVVEPLRPNNVPDVGMMADYRTVVLDPANEDLYGRPDPANLMYPRY